MQPKPYPQDLNYLVYPDGRIWSIRRKIFLSPFISKQGYYRVSLSNHKKYFVHRLVAETFIDNPDNLPQINHKDENKLNNNVDNLEWCTNSYNVNYGTRNKKVTTTKGYPICMLDAKTNKVLKIFSSANEAGRFLGKQNGANIAAVARKKEGHLTAYGYKWEYLS